ncbi:S49 family peptidase [Acetobacter tropicalis]|uniref:Bacteriophage minor capsid protein C n=1 Tax=Acetobacter tropicalis TaxID=104102 RepID=A0A094ZEX5_9PROT|nr:S49 family peptidase [Acetobacter tropicalis]KAA8387047.1 S49 family peptidase [Acetobacter tropicalis]KAA8391392.1 S49 family peptidase [Acetobacter tropicalis]KGB21161.1 Bacteriophage minor capsid protein C [Acetobacter tropicalis]MBC9008784.1 S49 family peptidase [Acetobacter tropicalis]MDO8171957.1 S49 family peptidase [Acetobacter tropicalis]
MTSRSMALTRQLLNRPLALSARHADILSSMLLKGGDDVMLFGPANDLEQFIAQQMMTRVDNVAIIKISGVLLPGSSNGFGWWYAGATFYDDIGTAFDLAIKDEGVKAIVLHIDSPGGTVAGCFDTAEQIYLARSQKPIVAIVDEMACSSGYALASAAETITLPRTGEVGSIGVVSMHVDITGALEQDGIKVTTFQFGDRKTDGYPTTPLSDEAIKSQQADTDRLGDLFVSTVARNRGLKPEAIRDMQAAVYRGQLGVEAGLADAVMSRTDAFTDLLKNL